MRGDVSRGVILTFASAASNESFTSLLDAESIAASRSALTSPLAAESHLAVDAPMVGTTAGRLGGTVEGAIWLIKVCRRSASACPAAMRRGVALGDDLFGAHGLRNNFAFGHVRTCVGGHGWVGMVVRVVRVIRVPVCLRVSRACVPAQSVSFSILPVSCFNYSRFGRVRVSVLAISELQATAPHRTSPS